MVNANYLVVCRNGTKAKELAKEFASSISFAEKVGIEGIGLDKIVVTRQSGFRYLFTTREHEKSLIRDFDGVVIGESTMEEVLSALNPKELGKPSFMGRGILRLMGITPRVP